MVCQRFLFEDSSGVEGPIEHVTVEKVMTALRKIKSGKATGPSDVDFKMIIAYGDTVIKLNVELCQRVLDGTGMPEEWKTSVVVPIFKGKGDVMSRGAYRGVKLLEQAMKIAERVLEKRIRCSVNTNKIQFSFMPGRGTIDALFILRRMQEEYQNKGKSYICVSYIWRKHLVKFPKKLWNGR